MLPYNKDNVLPRYDRDMGADLKKWRDALKAVGLTSGCFGCLDPKHGWRRDFAFCATDECPICHVKFHDARNGHCAVECHSFPQTPAEMSKLMSRISSVDAEE